MKNSYDNIFFKKVPIDNESNVDRHTSEKETRGNHRQAPVGFL